MGQIQLAAVRRWSPKSGCRRGYPAGEAGNFIMQQHPVLVSHLVWSALEPDNFDPAAIFSPRRDRTPVGIKLKWGGG